MTFSYFIAIYLFLGGTAAGSYAIAAAADLFFHFNPDSWGDVRGFSGSAGRRRFAATRRRIDRLVYSTSLVIIVVGILCLIGDLGRPEMFYALFMFPTMSFVSIGAFALTVLSICLMAALADALFVIGEAGVRFVRATKVVGIPVAFIVMIYTGLLLKSVMAVKIWDSWWLPALFLCSALSCGCAVAMLCVSTCEDTLVTNRWNYLLSRVDAVVVAAEAVSTASYLAVISNGAAASALQELLLGNLAQLFWVGFVCCGIVVPIIGESLVAMQRRPPSVGLSSALAGAALVGGLCLRLVVVASGVQTAI